MSIALSEDQVLFKNSAEKFIQESYDAAARASGMAQPSGFSRERWAEFSELGWTALTLPESDNGFGGSAVDMMILMEAFGRGLVVEPYVSSIVICGGLISELGSEEQKGKLLPELISGSKFLALAYTEDALPGEIHDTVLTPTADGKDNILNGRKAVVLDAPSADSLLVAACSPSAGGGLSLVLVDPTAAGVHIHKYRTLDGRHAADILFKNVKIGPEARLGTPNQTDVALKKALRHALIAVCAEAVGCMAQALSITRDYVAQRKQFGAALGSFQVVQHRLANIFMEIEMARSSVWLAAIEAGQSDLDDTPDLDAARIVVGQACRVAATDIVQLHGAMGMTEEYVIGQYFKRLKSIEIFLRLTGIAPAAA